MGSCDLVAGCPTPPSLYVWHKLKTGHSGFCSKWPAMQEKGLSNLCLLSICSFQIVRDGEVWESLCLDDFEGFSVAASLNCPNTTTLAFICTPSRRSLPWPHIDNVFSGRYREDSWPDLWNQVSGLWRSARGSISILKDREIRVV